MARKRRVFYDSVFRVLSNGLHLRWWSKHWAQYWAQHWTRWPTLQRRLPSVIYGLLVSITCLITVVVPGVASLPKAEVPASTSLKVIAQAADPDPADPASAAHTEAQRLEHRARDYYQAGQFTEASLAFEQAAQYYQEAGDPEQANESQLNRAKALQELGLYSRAMLILQEVLQPPDEPMFLLEGLPESENVNVMRDELQRRLEALPPLPTTVFALRSLGDTLQVGGNLAQAQVLLTYSLSLAGRLSLTEAIAPTYLSLGNLMRTQAIADLRSSNLTIDEAIQQLQASPSLSPIQQELQRSRTEAAQEFENQIHEALSYYQQAANDDGSRPLTQAQAQLNASSVYLDIKRPSDANVAIAALLPGLANLPVNQATLEARIKAAETLMRLSEPSRDRALSPQEEQAARLLETVLEQAHTLANASLDTDADNVPIEPASPRASQIESYALGSLGQLYLGQLHPRHSQLSETKQSTPSDREAPEIGEDRLITAKQFTQQALTKVNAISVNNLPLTVNDVDLAYRWYRQLGQILDAQDEREGAIEAYEAALQMLQERLRRDVASSNLNYRRSFSQEAQDPVHRELMDLLLRPEEPSQDDLDKVREVTSSLLQSELTSFLQEPCTVATPQNIDDIVNKTANQNEALLYHVVLPDSLEIIVKLPVNEGAKENENGEDTSLLHRRSMVSQDELLETINKLKLALEEDYTFEEVNTLAQRLYDWMIKPVETELQANAIDTLVFTLDRLLQPIPMAALYDGRNHLIEQYAIAEFLGLIEDSSTTQLQPGDLKVMAAGLSTVPSDIPADIRETLQPLAYVPRELEVLRNQRISVTTLEDNDFTLTNFNDRLNDDQFPIVHLATHGQFSFDPQKTFLLTSGTSPNIPSDASPDTVNIPSEESTVIDRLGSALGDILPGSTDPVEEAPIVLANDPEDALFTVDELAALFRIRGQIREDAIELLVLNACETAAGDDLATLGIGGTAIRAGASSAIASLWTLDDAPNVLFTQVLYEHLQKPNVSRADALRQAQLALMEQPQYQHPRYWSPYILAGNWLPLTAAP